MSISIVSLPYHKGMSWKCYYPTSFQFISHEATMPLLTVWTQDARTFFGDQLLTKNITMTYDNCALITRAMTRLMDQFNKRDVLLSKLYKLLIKQSFLPNTLIFLIIDNYLSHSPKDTIHDIR